VGWWSGEQPSQVASQKAIHITHRASAPGAHWHHCCARRWPLLRVRCPAMPVSLTATCPACLHMPASAYHVPSLLYLPPFCLSELPVCARRWLAWHIAMLETALMVSWMVYLWWCNRLPSTRTLDVPTRATPSTPTTRAAAQRRYAASPARASTSSPWHCAGCCTAALNSCTRLRHCITHFLFAHCALSSRTCQHLTAHLANTLFLPHSSVAMNIFIYCASLRTSSWPLLVGLGARAVTAACYRHQHSGGRLQRAPLRRRW